MSLEKSPLYIHHAASYHTASLNGTGNHPVNFALQFNVWHLFLVFHLCIRFQYIGEYYRRTSNEVC